MLLLCPIVSQYSTDWTLYSTGRTAITGLLNSCVPVIDADDLDTGVCVCIIGA